MRPPYKRGDIVYVNEGRRAGQYGVIIAHNDSGSRAYTVHFPQPWECNRLLFHPGAESWYPHEVLQLIREASPDALDIAICAIQSERQFQRSPGWQKFESLLPTQFLFRTRGPSAQ